MGGWRARIGIIYPADGFVDHEFWKFVPEGVTLLITRIGVLTEEISVDAVEYLAATDEIEKASRLLALGRPEVIAYACTSASFLKNGYESELGTRIQKASKGIPAVTTTKAVIDALRSLKVKRLAVLAAYPREIRTALKEYLESHDFKVSAVKGVDVSTEWEIGNIPPEELYRLAREVVSPDADGLFIPGTGLATADILDHLERDLGKPVVSANQATMWKALQIAKIRAPVLGHGRLLEMKG